MTLIVVLVLGLGVLLIISGLEDTPFAKTFVDIVKGVPLGPVGERTVAASPSTRPANPTAVATVTPPPSGTAIL